MNQGTFEAPKVAAPGEPHLACVLLVDTSGSMEGDAIESLNESINQFKKQTAKDPMAQKRVDIAIIEFNDHANVVQDFVPISKMEPIKLEAGGLTNMAEGINLAIDKVKERNRFYASLGTPCFKPWIFMISDGAPYIGTSKQAELDSEMEMVAERIRTEENKGSHGKLKFFALGISNYDKETLFKLTKRVMALTDTDFSGIFNWMSESMVAISVSRVDENVQLGNLPSNAQVVPSDW